MRAISALVIAHETQDRDLGAGGVMNEGLYASWLGLPAFRARPRRFRSSAT
jgi:hypothetical protein